MIFYILAAVGFFWGLHAGRVARTMSNGPKQGTTFGAHVFGAIGGVVFGAVAGLIGAAPFLAGLLIGGFTGLATTFFGFLAASALSGK